MKYCLKLALLLLLTSSSRGQQITIDNLKTELNTVTTDSTRFWNNLLLATAFDEIYRDSALYYVNRCQQVAEQNNYPLAKAFALQLKGYILMHLERITESLQCFLEADKIASDPGNETNRWTDMLPRQARLLCLGYVHQNWGHLMGYINVHERIYHYHKSKQIAEELGDSALLGLVNMNLGDAYLKINKTDSALLFERKAAELILNSREAKYISFVFYTMGNIFLRTNKKDSAVYYFNKGVQASAIHAGTLSVNLAALSTYYLEQKNSDSCLYYARKNLQTLRSLGETELGASYKLLSQCFGLTKNKDSVSFYQGLALASIDSAYNERINKLTELQKISFNEQQRLQDLEQEKIDTKNKIRMYGLLGGLTAFLVIGLILYRNNRQKQKANRVLESTLTNLKSAQTQLIQSEKMASLGELTAGIAHEIQNPLNFVNNFSEVNEELLTEMKDEMSKGKIADALALANDAIENQKKINHHGRRADAIVKGMLQHSRAGSGAKEPTDINALADEYLRLAYHGLKAKDKPFNAVPIAIGIKTDFDNTIGNINIIPQDIGRVILNLINNAFYACTELSRSAASLPSPDNIGINSGGFKNPNYKHEPTVWVSTKRVGDKVLISVRDNGPGIPQKILDKIFQPFFTTKPAGQGTGLGLSLAYDIIKAHGGELKVETKEGEGAEFSILLPA